MYTTVHSAWRNVGTADGGRAYMADLALVVGVQGEMIMCKQLNHEITSNSQ